MQILCYNNCEQLFDAQHGFGGVADETNDYREAGGMEGQQEKEASSADRCTPMRENLVAKGLRS